jgi:hypothetical protein
MKGKKKDTQFINNFIIQCVMLGINNSNDIRHQAEKMVKDIDQRLKQVVQDKKMRAQLLDVLEVLQDPNKEKKSITKFLYIQNTDLCLNICSLIKKGKNDISQIFRILKKSEPADIIFAVKQLSEEQVLNQKNGKIRQDVNFQEYLKFGDK